MAKARAYLGLGSNLGERRANLEAAFERLDALPGTRVIKRATIIETAPVGGPEGQGEFLNTACLIETDMPPHDLLDAIHRIERDIGRLRERETVRWGPRAIDIDILLWEGLTLSSPELTIPHPRLAEREFALRPLAEVDADAVHPTEKATIGELLKRIPQTP